MDFESWREQQTTKGNYNELGQCQVLWREVRLFKPTYFVEVAVILM